MKLLYGYFLEDTGQSLVALIDKNNKVYTGEARLHPDDKDFAKKYSGCDIAECRAWIKYLKDRRRIFKIKLDTIQKLKKDIEINCDLNNIDAKFLKRINLKIRDYMNEIKQINFQIEQFNQHIQDVIKSLDIFIKQVKKNQQKQEKSK